MAHIKQVEGRSYPFLYNVDMTVGTRQSGWEDGWKNYEAAYYSNRRDDVMLVQYLLKRVYQKGQNVQPQLQPNGANPAELKIDGYYGPKTQKAITQFQLEMRNNGRSIATDGCVDKELGESGISSISKTAYTITWLNKYFWVLYPQLAPNIAQDPECPPELKQSLLKGSAAGL
jgi:hypothetical protein